MRLLILLPMLASMSLVGCAQRNFEETHIVKCSYGEWWNQCDAKAKKLCEDYKVKFRYGAQYKDGVLVRQPDDFINVRTMAITCPSEPNPI